MDVRRFVEELQQDADDVSKGALAERWHAAFPFGGYFLDTPDQPSLLGDGGHSALCYAWLTPKPRQGAVADLSRVPGDLRQCPLRKPVWDVAVVQVRDTSFEDPLARGPPDET